MLVLAKLANFVPEAGLWMNTQRPEWNDANNALVGNGASVVTLSYLRRFLALRARSARHHPARRSRSRSSWRMAFERMRWALRAHRAAARRAAPIDEPQRRVVLEALGHPFSEYRAEAVPRTARRATAVPVAPRGRDRLLRRGPAARRPHAAGQPPLRWPVPRLQPDQVRPAAAIRMRRLPEMLEGQVAVLSSGALDIDQSLALLDALRASALYRADQDSYLLYPDRQLPAFLEKNRVPPEAVRGRRPGWRATSSGSDPSRPCWCATRTAGSTFTTASATPGSWPRALDAARPIRRRAGQPRSSVLELYERVFDHHSFTGRSGTLLQVRGAGLHLLAHGQQAAPGGAGGLAPAAARRGARRDHCARLREHYLQHPRGPGRAQAARRCTARFPPTPTPTRPASPAPSSRA